MNTSENQKPPLHRERMLNLNELSPKSADPEHLKLDELGATVAPDEAQSPSDQPAKNEVPNESSES